MSAGLDAAIEFHLAKKALAGISLSLARRNCFT
jgi:hypothetical protein